MYVLQKLHKEFPTRVVEWGLSYIIITWASVLVLWPDLMYTGVNPTYDSWLGIMRQSLWAMVGLVIGGVRLSALYINGAHVRSPVARLAMGFLSMGFWFLVFIGVVRAGPSTGWAVYPWLMLADGYAVYVAGGDAWMARENWRAKQGVRHG